MKKGVFMSSDSTTTHSWRKLQNGAEIRGSEALLTDEFARRIGYVFAQWLAERLGTTSDRLTLAVGRDSRHSGPRLKAALIRGMTAADCDVFDCDLCTTPAMYMATVAPETHANGAIMVTGSHYSFDRNGFKFILREGHLSAEDVTGLIERAECAEIPERLVRKIDFLEIYAERLRQMVRRRLEDDALKPLLGLHVVVDAGGGAGGFYADVLERSGRVDVDGQSQYLGARRRLRRPQFPTPRAPTRMEAVARGGECENEADLGVIFDRGLRPRGHRGSGRASVIHRNRLIALTSAILLDEIAPARTIVTDSGDLLRPEPDFITRVGRRRTTATSAATATSSTRRCA